MSKKRVREKNTEMLAIKQLLWAGVEMQSVLEAAQSCVFQLLEFQMCNNFCNSIYFINAAHIFTVKVQASRSTISPEQQARWAWHLVMLQEGVLGRLPVHDWQKVCCTREVILHTRRTQSTDYSDFMTFGQDGVWRAEKGPWDCWEAKAGAWPLHFAGHGLEPLQVETKSWQGL